MANEVTMPRLGWDMEEGALGSWLKNDGEFIEAGDLLFTVEGEKAVQEIEALDNGYLRIPPNSPEQGVLVPVGALLAYIVDEEELAGFSFPETAPAEVDPPPEVQSEPESSPSMAAVPDVDDNQKRRVWISPYARRMAENLGVDWKKVKGSGDRNRIMALDIEKAAEQSGVSIPTPVLKTVTTTTPQTTSSGPGVTRIAMSQTRRMIADHMQLSAQSTVPVTLILEVNATELVSMRKALKSDGESRDQIVPSYNDILAKITAQSLMEFPNMNARIDGSEIVQFSYAHIGLAVDTERGLLVPVLRDVQSKSLRQIARESASLIEETRQGSIGIEEMQGGTFTITNLGMFDIEAFTPVINYPEAAILGAGKIIPRQVVVDAENEKVVIQQRMTISLTFDHRLVDGAQAARFLQRIKQFIEAPVLWLVGQG
jgi:pyruvate dehydrogenase E2 component (dihydrolipoamide acetyltransferase)